MERRANAASDQTKQALAAALKELMAQKPLEKITIQDLAERAGIRRQNFYYHFEDVYDLMRWMFQEEAVSLLQASEGVLLWQEGLLQLLRYLEANRAVCLCALQSVGRSHLERFFEADLHAILYRTIERFAGEVCPGRPGLSESDAALLTHLYVVGFSAVAESWLLGEIDRSAEELVAFVDLHLQDQLRGARARLEEAGG